MADKKYNILLTAADETKAAFESANNNIEKMTGGLVSLQGLMAGVSVGALVDVVKTSADAADEMGKAAQKVGTTTEALSQLKYAAELSNVPFDALEKGLEKISKAAYDATTVGGALAKSFEQMGISTTDSNGKLKDSSVLLGEVADKFSHMQDGSAKTALAMSLFGKAGADMIPMLNEGSAGLKEMADQADKLGITISSNTAAEANRFEDNLTRLHAAGTGMTNQLTAALLPALNEVTQAFVDGAHDGETLAVVTGTVKTAFEAVVILGANVAFTFHQIGEDIGGIAAQAAALAHGDFSGFKRIGEEMKTQAAAANKELDDFDNRILHPPTPPAIEQHSGFTPTIDDTKAIASLDKLLAASKSFDDQSTAAHEDAFNKWLTKWKEIEDQLTAEGTKGNKARMAHEAAYTTYVNAENTKRNDAAMQHLNQQVNNETLYFAKIHAMALDATTTALGREKLRYDREVMDLKNRQALEAKDHQLSLAELAGFHQAELDLETDHQAKMIALKDTSGYTMVNGEKHYNEMSLGAMSDFFGTSKGLMNSHSRAMFEIGKAGAISEAVIHTYSSATKAFDAMAGIYLVGPALGAIAAAAAIASGLAQVSAIESTSFGSSGSGGGSYGGANSSLNGGQATPNFPSTPAPPSPSALTNATIGTPAQAPTQVNITIAGSENSIFTYDQVVNNLIPTINKAASNGVNIKVALNG